MRRSCARVDRRNAAVALLRATVQEQGKQGHTALLLPRKARSGSGKRAGGARVWPCALEHCRQTPPAQSVGPPRSEVGGCRSSRQRTGLARLPQPTSLPSADVPASPKTGIRTGSRLPHVAGVAGASPGSAGHLALGCPARGIGQGSTLKVKWGPRLSAQARPFEIQQELHQRIY